MKMTSNKNYFTLLSIAILLVFISLTNISDAKKVKTLGSKAPRGSQNKKPEIIYTLADGKVNGFYTSCPSIKLDLKTFILEAECNGKTEKYTKISTLDLNLCFKTVFQKDFYSYAQDLSNPGFANIVDIKTCEFKGTVFNCEDKQEKKRFYTIDLNKEIGNLDGVMNLHTCKAKFVKQINK